MAGDAPQLCDPFS